MSGAVRTARAEADAARARLQASAAEAKYRLSPSTIANHVIGDVKERTGVALDVARDRTGVAAGQSAAIARERPALAGTAAGVVTVLLIRKPLVRLLRRLFGPVPTHTIAATRR